MKWEKVGDKISGTLINRRTMISQLSGNEQAVYEVKLDGEGVTMNGEKQATVSGDVWLVGGRAFIDNQLQHVNIGQVIGLLYEKDKPNSNPKFNPTKCIQVFANADAVDKEWLESKDTEESEVAVADGGRNGALDDFNKELDEAAMTDTRNKIIQLAQEKLGASNDIEDVKLKVMEKTKKAFIDQNLDALLAELQQL